MSTQAAPPPGTLAQTLRALRSRNFRLFFAGQTVSLIGTWIQQIAMSWLVYRLTGSAFMLGIVGFVATLPGVFITPFAGVAADRWNRHRMVIATQTGAMLQALALAALVLTGTVRVWHILALSAFVGVVNGFDMPARQSFLLEMVERKEDLPNAIALNSSMFNGARLVGPAIAGALIAAVGEGICFLINGLSFLAVLVALLAMRVPRRELPAGRLDMLRDLGDGFRYAFRSPAIRMVLAFLAVASLFAQPYTVLMPVVATRVLHGGAHTLGLLMAATGLGALSGALYLATRPSVVGLGRVLVVGGASLALAGSRHRLCLSARSRRLSGLERCGAAGLCPACPESLGGRRRRAEMPAESGSRDFQFFPPAPLVDAGRGAHADLAAQRPARFPVRRPFGGPLVRHESPRRCPCPGRRALLHAGAARGKRRTGGRLSSAAGMARGRLGSVAGAQDFSGGAVCAEDACVATGRAGPPRRTAGGAAALVRGRGGRPVRCVRRGGRT